VKAGRNDPCRCGSGRKYKQCCLQGDRPRPGQTPQRPSPEAARCNDRACSLQAEGRLDEAITWYREAIRLAPGAADLHYNLGTAYHAQGGLDQAIACYRAALALQPALAMAHNNLGNAWAARGDFDQAAACYQNALALHPGHVEAHYNLGVARQAQGRLDEAARCYIRVIELRPGVAAAHNDLGNVLDAMGRSEQALASYRRALELGETPQVRSNFARCLRDVAWAKPDRRLRHLVPRAIDEAWARPSDLARAGASILRASAPIDALLTRAARAWPARLAATELYGPTGLRELSHDALLRALLHSAPVRDIALERLLTLARFALLQEGLQAAVIDAFERNSAVIEALDRHSAVIDAPERQAAGGATRPAAAGNASFTRSSGAAALDFACALARQCFINEYVFACTDEELEQAATLRDRVAAALASDAPVAPLALAAVAAYFPLHALAGGAALSNRAWPDPVMPLLAQQIEEPRAEAHLREAMARLTPIEGAVTMQVREQYEENPYPRWVRLPELARTHCIDDYLHEQFPFATLRPLGTKAVDFLIAGCGTGQESIEAARRFPDTCVLAVDLSLASLGYARRKTIEAGVHNVEYAQADILALDSIGRTFDVVSSMGVLHHLADPLAGLRVLTCLLRPGGFMRLGLYSEHGRSDVVAARRFIAERGDEANAAAIRCCRQDLIEQGPRFERVTSRPGFCTMSECRDLLFHVHEHRLDLSQIGQMLAECGLTFIGFLLEPSVVQRYRSRHPEDRAAVDLTRWHRFEAEHPDTFAGMYRFWVQKRSSA
jgi:Flp pilus assembly protein TadD/2-polyprenyl-3-methyl-5-hydroxy-6-metoxy-1,4-benzoquinol methylase